MINNKTRVILVIMIASIAFGIISYRYLSPPPDNPVPPAANETTESSVTVATSSSTDVVMITTEPAVKPLVLLERFKPLLEQNDDVVGWVTLPNTKIDYPIAQSNDNDFYLHRDLDKKKYEPGTIFMDFRNDALFENRHTILFGHNMKDGSMFGTLKYYKKESFYDANRLFTYSTLYGETQWEIFAAYVSIPTLDLITTDFADDQAFLDYIATRQKESQYPADSVIKATDKILTLITCSYEFNDARFVIHARLVQ